MHQTHYVILGVDETATDIEIKRAFTVRAAELHPDRVFQPYLKEVAAEAFKRLSEAKSVLLDPAARRKYDAKLAYERGSKSTTFYSPSPARSAPQESTENTSNVPSNSSDVTAGCGAVFGKILVYSFIGLIITLSNEGQHHSQLPPVTPVATTSTFQSRPPYEIKSRKTLPDVCTESKMLYGSHEVATFILNSGMRLRVLDYVMYGDEREYGLCVWGGSMTVSFDDVVAIERP